MNWEIIFKDAVPSVAGVVVYDHGSNGGLGRYTVAKTMKVPSGHTRMTQSYYSQRPAALRYARKFLDERAAKAGTKYVPGDGAKTLLFSPVTVGGVS